MKVLSLLQPYASLVVSGFKTIETRSWKTNYSGPLLIHASAAKKTYARNICESDYFRQGLPHKAVITAAMIRNDESVIDFDGMPFGAIIGQVELVDIRKIKDADKVESFAYYPEHGPGKLWDLNPREKAYGNYEDGRYAWLLENPKKFKTAIPAKGKLSIWDFPMCKVCGCWEMDACFHSDHGNCSWAAEDLCSHCKNIPGEASRISKMFP